nr:RteC domain-containing protein [Porphyromonas cangingivalis]
MQLCFSELEQVLSIELEILEKGLKKTNFSDANLQKSSSIHWTGKVVDLVELLYALDTCNCINNGEIGVEELSDRLSKVFGVEIKNCYNVYMNMKHRKDESRTYFLDELKEKLNRRMVESDIRGGKYKRR